MKKQISILLCFVFLCILWPVPASAATVGGSYISSQGACVIDYETGDVLYSYNGDTPRVPASMTKIMNLYCVYEALANGEIALDTPVPISQSVYNKSRNWLYQSVLPLYYNTTYTVDEMMDIAVVYSASGAAVALAELVGGGSEAAFVQRMNDTAARMGLNAQYFDSCGIANNLISPISMAQLARNIIRDYPDILQRSAKRSVTFHGYVYPTTDHLLDTYYYAGADGLKTGTTSAAGYCFCGTAVRNGRRMISVTMQSSSTGQRFVDTARLLDYGFAQARERYGSVFYTDMRVFLNGYEMPAYACNSQNPRALILAEKLWTYGFDVYSDEASQTVTAIYKPYKEVVPLPLEDYQGEVGAKAWPILDAKVRVIVDDGAQQHEIADTYNIGMFVLIPVDALGEIYDLEWDEEARIYSITVTERTPDPTDPTEETPTDPTEETPTDPTEEAPTEPTEEAPTEPTEEAPTEPTEEAPTDPTGEPPTKSEAQAALEAALTSQSAFIMDYESGAELFALDADTRKPAASIAKMMSVYVLLDAVRAGELSLDTPVPISENVYKLSRNEDYKMMVPLEYGVEYTLDEMIDMIVIDSAAACVTAAAELLCGDEARFVQRMNAKAQEIGIGSEFHNGTGVCLNPDTDGQENLMSAREIAIMTRHMIQDYPEILERTRRSSVEFHGKTYYNLNKLFTDYPYEGADGFKNGMTEASGYCMCGTAEREGKRVITVTLPSASNEARFTDSILMFDYGFRQLGVDPTADPIEESPEQPLANLPTDANEITINIDGNYVLEFPDQKPVIRHDRVLIPIRALMETLGKTVEWDGATRQVTIHDETTSVTLTIEVDSFQKTVNNPLDGTVTTETIPLDAPPEIIGDRTCLPVRAVVEAFGAAVIWEAETRTVLIIAGVC